MPLPEVGAVRRDKADIIALDIHRAQHMECLGALPAQQQVARQVLIIGVRLDQLLGVDRRQDRLARNEAARKAHIHVVSPEDSTSTNAVLDEADRVVRKPALRSHSIVSVPP